MKAVIYTNYGPPEVLRLAEVEKPSPAAHEVLVRVHATTVNRTDCGFRSATYVISRFVTGLIKPTKIITGSEFAGEIVEVGSEVRNFKVGDTVFGFNDTAGGAHAEYKVEAADGPIAKMPPGFSYQEVAPAGEGATYALSIIRAAGVKKGQRVLVYGASGAIGSAAVQILKYLGASVTAVCGAKNVELIKSLRADTVINFEVEDFTQSNTSFDFILDAVGKSSYGACKKLLSPTGMYCSTELGAFWQNPLLALWFAMTGSRKVIFPIPKINKEVIEYIKHIMESGSYRPVIDRTYPLNYIVEAARYVETGEKTGNVVITI